MANRDMPKGGVPVKHLNGNPYNGKYNVYYKDAAEDFFIGTPVKLAGSADPTGMFPTVTRVAATEVPIVGFVVGFSTSPYITADPANLDRVYSPSAEDVYIAVADDPDLIFEMQEDTGTTLTIASVGLNCSMTTESGSTVTGNSSVEIDGSEVAETGTLGIKLLRYVNREDNAVGAHAKWEVMVNKHSYGHGLGCVGL